MFRDNLKEQIEYKGIIIKELAAKTGIPKPTISCYLSARQTMPTAEAAVKIAKALNVSVEFLVTGKDSKIVPRDFEKFLSFSSILNDLERLSKQNRHCFEIMLRALADSDEGSKNK